MAYSVDERVVRMMFENKEFMDNLNDTIDGLDNLDKSMNLNGAANRVGKETQEIGNHFSKMNTLVTGIILGLGNDIEKFVVGKLKKLANGLNEWTIKPLKDGMKEYELKVGMYQTLINNAKKRMQVDIDKDGNPVYDMVKVSEDDVNKAITELDKYADKTIYNVQDMFRNITTFTNKGVDLNDAVKLLEGIDNAAALAGLDAQKAAVSMNNFADAMGAGYMELRDWKSISRVAHLDTPELLQMIADEAVAVGTLKKVGEGLYATSRDTYELNDLFNSALKDHWMITDAWLPALQKYADEETEIGKRAYKAATQVKTFSQLIEILHEALGTGWSDTWQIIFGDYSEAVELWTPIYDRFSKIIDAFSDFRNGALQMAKDLGARAKVIEGLFAILDGIGAALRPISEGFHDVFGSNAHIINKFAFIISDAASAFDRFAQGFKAFFERSEYQNSVRMLSQFVSALAGGLIGLGVILKSIIKPLATLAGYVGAFAFGVIDSLLYSIGGTLLTLITPAIETIKGGLFSIAGWIDDIGHNFTTFITDNILKAIKYVDELAQKIQDFALNAVKPMTEGGNFWDSKAGLALINAWTWVVTTIVSIKNRIVKAWNDLITFLDIKGKNLPQILSDAFGFGLEQVSRTIKMFQDSVDSGFIKSLTGSILDLAKSWKAIRSAGFANSLAKFFNVLRKDIDFTFLPEKLKKFLEAFTGIFTKKESKLSPESIKEQAENVKQAAKGFGKVFSDGIASMFNSVDKVIESYAKKNTTKMFLDIAEGMLMLASAVAILALASTININVDNFKALMLALAAVGGIITGVILLSTLNIGGSKTDIVKGLSDKKAILKYFGDEIIGVAGKFAKAAQIMALGKAIEAMAISFAIIAASIRFLLLPAAQAMTPEVFGRVETFLLSIGGILGVFALILTMLDGEKGFQKSAMAAGFGAAAALIGFALLEIVATLLIIKQMMKGDPNDFWNAAYGLAAIVGGMVLVFHYIGSLKDIASAADMIAFAASMSILSIGLALMLADMALIALMIKLLSNGGPISDGINAFTGIALGIIVFVEIMALITRSMNDVDTVSFLVFSAACVILSIAIGSMTLVIGLMAGLVHLAGFGSIVLAAGGILLFVYLLSSIAASLSHGLVDTRLFVLFSAACILLSVALIPMTICIGLMAAMVSGIGIPSVVVASLIILGVIRLMVSIARSMKDVEIGKMVAFSGALIVMSIAMGLMSLVLGIFAILVSVAGIDAAMVAAIIVGSMLALMVLIGERMQDVNMKGLLLFGPSLILLSAGLAVFAVAMGLMAIIVSLNPLAILGAAFVMIGIIAAMIAISRLFKSGIGDMLKFAASILLISSSLLLFAFDIVLFQNILAHSSIGLGASLAMIVAILVVLTLIAKFGKYVASGLTTVAASIGLFDLSIAGLGLSIAAVAAGIWVVWLVITNIAKGIADWLSTNPFGRFAESVKNFFTGTGDSAEKAKKQIEDYQETVDPNDPENRCGFKGLDWDKDKSNEVVDTADQSLTETVEEKDAGSDAGDSLKENLVGTFVDGLKSGDVEGALSDTINQTMEGMVGDVDYDNIMAMFSGGMTKSGLDLSKLDMSSYMTKGSEGIDNFVSGVSDKLGEVEKSGNKIADTAINGVNEKVSEFKDAGKNYGLGFANGIISDASKVAVKNSSDALAKIAANALKDAGKIHSPSKLTEEFGRFWTQGFALGMVEGTDDVENSTSAVVRSMAISLQNLANGVYDGVNLNPTITPVLDLSNVDRGLNGLFGRTSMGLSQNITHEVIQNQNGSMLLNALGNLSATLSGQSAGNSYVINGITYDDGSNVANAVQSLIQAAQIEGRA